MASLRDWRSLVAPIAILAASYFIAGKFGLMLAFVHASASAVWPPTGIALAALLLFGWRLWPGVLLGAFLVNLTTAGSVVSSLGIAVGNTLEALVGAYLVDRFAHGRHAFDRPEDVFKFALLAAVGSTTVSATLGVSSLALTGYARWADFAAIWLTWWLGDAAGALIVAPPLVLWATNPRARGRSRSALETILLPLALLLSGLAVFGGLTALSLQNYPLEFVVFPPLVWAAFRFGPRATGTAIVVLCGIAIWGTLRGFGPFARGTDHESLLLLQAFMGVAAVTALALAAAVLQEQRAEDVLRAAELRRAEDEQTRLAREQALRAEAEAAVAVRDEFLSLAAHELRTPLTAIKAYAQLMEGKGEYSPRGLEVIIGRVKLLERLIDDLLDLSRLQIGRLELRCLRVDLVTLAQQVLEQVDDGKHRLRLEAPPTPVVGVWDSDRLEQVLANLVSNAIKYSPRGEEIAVTIRRLDDRVEVAVRDRGEGIPAEALPRVFDRFYRVPRGETGPSGLGLGLAISKALVEAHGGTITAASAGPGQGSTFAFTLPDPRP
jgi:signal transduction histidine kinase